MSNASRVTQLQDRMADRSPRIQITEIIEHNPQPEFDSVGAELRAHRNRKGHELEMAGRVLRIKPAHLQAIEESNYGALPGKAYAIGFVRSYAEYLGLEPNDCIRRFKIEYTEAMEPQAEEGETAPRNKGAKVAFPEARDEMRLPHGSMIILGAMLVLFVWGGWYVTTNSERAFTDAAMPEESLLIAEEDLPPSMVNAAAVMPSPQRTPATSTETSAMNDEAAAATDEATTDAAVTDTTATDAAATEPVVTDAADAAATETDSAALDAAPLNEVVDLPADREPQVFGTQNFDARVIVRARADAWVRVEDTDGTVLFETVMQRGDSYRVPNRASIILATRNAGAVEMLLDGASLGPVGAIGQAVIEQSLDPAVLAANAPTQP